MSSREMLDELISEMKKEFPRFEIRFKDESKLMKVIGVLLFFNSAFMTRYTTVLFGKVYFPTRSFMYGPLMELTAYRILWHERRHLRQARKWPVIFQLTYLLVLPAGFTMRAFWEYQAYVDTLEVHIKLYGKVHSTVIPNIVEKFVGPAYLFMLFWFLRGWLTRKLEAQAKRLLEAEDDV